MQVTSDQMRGMFTFSIDTGVRLCLREESRQVEVRLEADVDREGRDEALGPRDAGGFALRK